jgi:hypothetical protein
MSTQMDLDQQDTAAQLLKEGARLLYTVAAGQFFELGDINAWFERYNALAGQLELSDPFGAIGAISNPADPLIDQASAKLEDLAARAVAARDDFAEQVAGVRAPRGTT